MILDEELKDDLAGSTANVILIKDNKIYCVSTKQMSRALFGQYMKYNSVVQL